MVGRRAKVTQLSIELLDSHQGLLCRSPVLLLLCLSNPNSVLLQQKNLGKVKTIAFQELT